MSTLAMDNLPRIRRLGRLSIVVAVLCSIIVIALAFIDAAAFFEGYLTAFALWISVGMGCMAILMMHHLTGGRWGWSLRRPLEAGVLTVPVLSVLFLPLLAGVATLYPWAAEQAPATHALIPFREAYLTTPMFILRSIGYLLAVSIIALLLFWWSSRQHDEEDHVQRTKLQRLSSIGLIVYVLATTFAFFDWIASLTHSWTSSIYGLYWVVGQALTAFTVAALLTIVVRRPRDVEAHRRILPDDRLQDIGTLLLALIILYTYMAFSQFFITWNGNLPDAIQWYVHRQEGAWAALTVLLIVMNFFLPFFALLSRDLKRKARALLIIVSVVLAARLLDVAWLILPSFESLRNLTIPVAVAAAAGLGAIYLAIVMWHWQRRPLALQEIPAGDSSS